MLTCPACHTQTQCLSLWGSGHPNWYIWCFQLAYWEFKHWAAKMYNTPCILGSLLMHCLKANKILILKWQAGDTVIYPKPCYSFWDTLKACHGAIKEIKEDEEKWNNCRHVPSTNLWRISVFNNSNTPQLHTGWLYHSFNMLWKISNKI